MTTTPPYPPAPRMARPLGVTIIAILEFLQGIFYLLIAFGLFVGGAFLAGAGGLGGLFAGLAIAAGVIVLLIAILFLILGWGLLTGRSWAWTVAVVLAILAILIGIIGLVGGDLSQLIGIVIQFIVLYYLWRPYVKAYFGRA